MPADDSMSVESTSCVHLIKDIQYLSETMTLLATIAPGEKLEVRIGADGSADKPEFSKTPTSWAFAQPLYRWFTGSDRHGTIDALRKFVLQFDQVVLSLQDPQVIDRIKSTPSQSADPLLGLHSKLPGAIAGLRQLRTTYNSDSVITSNMDANILEALERIGTCVEHMLHIQQQQRSFVSLASLATPATQATSPSSSSTAPQQVPGTKVAPMPMSYAAAATSNAKPSTHKQQQPPQLSPSFIPDESSTASGMFRRVVSCKEISGSTDRA